MALTQLADIIEPQFFAEYMAFNSMTSTALFQSGILQQNPLLDAHVAGRFLPMWGDLAATNDASGTEPISRQIVRRTLLTGLVNTSTDRLKQIQVATSTKLI